MKYRSKQQTKKRAATFRNLEVGKLDLWDQVGGAEDDHNLYKTNNQNIQEISKNTKAQKNTKNNEIQKQFILGNQVLKGAETIANSIFRNPNPNFEWCSSNIFTTYMQKH